MSILPELKKTQTKCHEIVYIYKCSLQSLIWCIHTSYMILIMFTYFCILKIYMSILCIRQLHLYRQDFYTQLLHLHTRVVFIVQLGPSTYLVIIYAFWTRNWKKIILSIPFHCTGRKKQHFSFIWYSVCYNIFDKCCKQISNMTECKVTS